MVNPLASIPPYDLVERDRRWERVREAMGARGIDLLIVLPQSDTTDARYLAQEIGAVLFPLSGEPWILLGGEDSHLAVERDGWIHQRSSATPGGSNRVPYGAVVAAKLRELKLRLRRVGIAGLDGDLYSQVRSADGYVLYSTTKRILDALGGAEVVNGAPVMASARYVKSEAEIAATRAGVQVGEVAVQAIGDAFRIGSAQADAYRAGFSAMLHPGVGSPFFGGVPVLAWCPGRWAEPRPRFVGTPPGVIDDGLCVATEIITVIQGAFAQVAEPFIAGQVTDEQQEIFELSLATFEATCKALHPGATWREVRQAASAVAEGSDWNVCFLLHGGQDGPLFVPGDTHDEWLDDKVEANTTFVCKPHVFPARQHHVVARSHDVTWGESVVVRDNGAERLGTRTPRLVSYH